MQSLVGNALEKAGSDSISSIRAVKEVNNDLADVELFLKIAKKIDETTTTSL